MSTRPRARSSIEEVPMWPFKRNKQDPPEWRDSVAQSLARQHMLGTTFDFDNTPGVWVEYDAPLPFSKRMRIYLAGNVTLERSGWTRSDPEYMPWDKFRDCRLRLLQVVQPDATVHDLDGGLDPSKIRFHRHYIAFSQRLGDDGPDIHSSAVVFELLAVVQELAGWESLPEVRFSAPPNAGDRWAVSS